MKGFYIKKHAFVSVFLSLIAANALAESAKTVTGTEQEDTSILSTVIIEDRIRSAMTSSPFSKVFDTK